MKHLEKVGIFSYSDTDDTTTQSTVVLVCEVKMGCNYYLRVKDGASLRDAVDAWKDHLRVSHEMDTGEDEVIEVGSYVSTPGGRIGKVVDIEPERAYPVLVRFEFDGYSYKMSDLRLVPKDRQ